MFLSPSSSIAAHEPQKVAQASCLFGADRLEACPTLQPAARFMAPTTSNLCRCPLPMNLTLVGTSRCDVPAREAAGVISAPLSAARTAQRAVPTRFRVQSAKISWKSSHEPESGSPALQRVAQFRFMGREQVRKEHGAFHEPWWARLRRALISVAGRSGLDGVSPDRLTDP